jgi:hypothetical protein
MSEQTGLYHPVGSFTNDRAEQLYEKAQMAGSVLS